MQVYNHFVRITKVTIFNWHLYSNNHRHKHKGLKAVSSASDLRTTQIILCSNVCMCVCVCAEILAPNGKPVFVINILLN